MRRSTRPVADRMGERPARPEAKGTCALPVLEGMPLRPPGSYRRKEHEWKDWNAGILHAPRRAAGECAEGAGGGYGCHS